MTYFEDILISGRFSEMITHSNMFEHLIALKLQPTNKEKEAKIRGLPRNVWNS